MSPDDDVRVERRISAKPADVYAYLTDSVLWARWQGDSAEIEAVPGGVFRMVMADGTTVEGSFVQLVPDTRVVFTWGWQGSSSLPPGSSTVEIELAPDADGTLLRLTHRGLPREERPKHEVGWGHYLPRLATAAAGGDPGPDALPT
jgi:uncharacterized protein YndB with AHSA1/START domain